MKKSVVALLLSIALFVPHVARADDSMKKALSVIPADAIGFVCVPNVKQLDADVQGTVQRLGLAGMVAPPFNSLETVLQMFLHVGEGFDANGAAAIVFLPAANAMELSQKQALILPASDPRKLLESMGATAGEGGVWSASLLGQPAVAMPGEKFIVLAQVADVAKAISSGQEKIAANFDPHDLNAIEGMDLVVWIDGERLIKVFKQQIDGFMGMFAMMQSAQGPMGAAQGEMTKKQVGKLVDGAASLALGIGLGDDGFTLRMGFRAKQGSDLAKEMKVHPTSESLLRGLPDDNYLFAFGATMDPGAATDAAGQLDGYFAMAEQADGMDAEQVEKLKGLLKDLAPLSTGLHGVVSAIAPGTDGMFGAALVLDTANSGKWADTFADMVDTAMKLPKSDDEGMDGDVKKALAALSFKRDAESVAGAKVHQLRFDVEKAEEMDDEDAEQLHKLLGSDGVMVRTAAVGDGNVVMTFGGGSTYFAKVVEQTKSKSAPLDGEAGIQAVNKRLPKERSGVAFFDVDRIIRWIGDVTKAVGDDDEPFPVKMPKLDAPLALVTTGGDGWQTSQLHIPSELMVATKDAVMGAMGGGAAPGDDTHESPDHNE